VASGVIDTGDHKKIDCIVEYLCEYEAICRKALTRGSRAQVELFDEKNRRSKSRDKVPLRMMYPNVILRLSCKIQYINIKILVTCRIKVATQIVRMNFMFITK
jgi:hypothetical protein